jgi:hypothetical protein
MLVNTKITSTLMQRRYIEMYNTKDNQDWDVEEIINEVDRRENAADDMYMYSEDDLPYKDQWQESMDSLEMY